MCQIVKEQDEITGGSGISSICQLIKAHSNVKVIMSLCINLFNLHIEILNKASMVSGLSCYFTNPFPDSVPKLNGIL